MVYPQKPPDFREDFEVVSCFCEKNGEILLLHRLQHKPYGGTWGMPAGKVQKNESVSHAIVRELEEETGIAAPSDELQFLDKVFVRHDDYDFVYYMYQYKVPSNVTVKINRSEHDDFLWIKPSGTPSLNLIQDLDHCLRYFQASD